MDSTATIVRCIQAAAKDLGLPVPDNKSAAYVIGLGLEEAMQAAMPNLEPKYYPRMVERYRYHYLAKDQDLTLFDGVRTMLTELSQQGYFLAVATGKSRVGLNRALDAAKLLTLWLEISGSRNSRRKTARICETNSAGSVGLGESEPKRVISDSVP